MAKDEVAATSKMGKMMVSAGFKKRVMLPLVYYNKLKEEKSEWAILKTPKGEWEVKVRRDDNGDIFLEDGWPEFARGNAFNDHDFMEFEHTCNKMHFNVTTLTSLSLRRCKIKALRQTPAKERQRRKMLQLPTTTTSGRFLKRK
ncbi:B3 domain-containing protein At4g34400-like [Salvia miltiorrhiza]|uniref:B3 domain-containing protein At4g34400-like n=1 Tax=Salvia miltiorrhiza TaxID=226208 RepID=UPI0025ACE16C|nr:B3 domain-containing protein At4g34400-like [Salvia miltiorrhiza]